MRKLTKLSDVLGQVRCRPTGGGSGSSEPVGEEGGEEEKKNNVRRSAGGYLFFFFFLRGFMQRCCGTCAGLMQVRFGDRMFAAAE